MGYYLNVNSKGQPLPARKKYEALIADGATPDDGKSFKDNLVCVVDNGPFEAAGYAFDKREYEAFSAPDSDLPSRPRRWLVHPMAKQLSGFEK